MNIIFEVSGGLGKHIASTAVCAAIKNNYPDSNLIVVCGYPDVFLNNPNIYRCIGYNNDPYFYYNYVHNKQTKFLLGDPYQQDSYVKGNEHLIQAWVHMFNMRYSQELPKLYLSEVEKINAKQMIVSDKPTLFFQPFGGPPSQPYVYNWNRDLSPEFAQKIADILSEKYSVIHVKNKEQLKLNRTTPLDNLEYRQLFALLLESKNRLFIDSFMQHAAAALDLPSVVCWITNTPQSLGYETHKNICPVNQLEPLDQRGAFYQKYSFYGGQLFACPFKDLSEIYNMQDLFQSIESIHNK
jgi:hypothetical protein